MNLPQKAPGTWEDGRCRAEESKGCPEFNLRRYHSIQRAWDMHSQVTEGPHGQVAGQVKDSLFLSSQRRDTNPQYVTWVELQYKRSLDADVDRVLVCDGSKDMHYIHAVS